MAGRRGDSCALCAIVLGGQRIGSLRASNLWRRRQPVEFDPLTQGMRSEEVRIDGECRAHGLESADVILRLQAFTRQGELRQQGLPCVAAVHALTQVQDEFQNRRRPADRNRVERIDTAVRKSSRRRRIPLIASMAASTQRLELITDAWHPRTDAVVNTVPARALSGVGGC